jgi:hypothetical protein
MLWPVANLRRVFLCERGQQAILQLSFLAVPRSLWHFGVKMFQSQVKRFLWRRDALKQTC